MTNINATNEFETFLNAIDIFEMEASASKAENNRRLIEDESYRFTIEYCTKEKRALDLKIAQCDLYLNEKRMNELLSPLAEYVRN